jgi:predicted glycosyltransferase
MKVWIDIENPPQAQYLSPFGRSFRDRGHEVIVTARDSGITHDLLTRAGVTFTPLGGRFGPGRVRKGYGVVARALRLLRLLRGLGRPSLLLSSSRSSALAARILKIPSFVVCDYEHVELRSYRLFDASLLFPEVIERSTFRAKGFTDDRLIPFRGLKEDITFAGVQERVPRRTRDDHSGIIQVLVRPPAEDSHYFSIRSRELLRTVLDRLSRIADLQVHLVPREAHQTGYLGEHRWAQKPVVLQHPQPAQELLRSVDWVLCGGGTMLREAACLSVPAVSIFQGAPGRVDRHLAAIGAIRVIESASELDALDLRRPFEPQPVPRNPELLQDLTQLLESRAAKASSPES